MTEHEQLANDEARHGNREALERLEAQLVSAQNENTELHELIRYAIAAEPELPGDMPDAMWEAIRNDRDACTNAMRAVVRHTKNGISTRLLECIGSR